jgi:site-specific DNA recombinase
LKVAIYIRVSTKRQVDKYSPSEQKRILTEFALGKEWEIHDYYSDLGESGTDSDRDELDRLLIDANKKLFSKVLLFEQDRLSRLEQLDWAYLANSLAKMNIKLVTPTSEINLDNEEDRFLADLFNLLANREVKKTKKRTSMGRRAAHHKGIYFGKEAPYGLIINRDTNKFRSVPEEVDNIKRMHELYRSGHSFRSIASILSELGCRGRYNGRFTPGQVRKTMLNSIHSGWFTQTILGETLIHKVQWEDGYSPYVSNGDYERVRKIAEERSNSFGVHYFHNPKYLLAGILTCDECGKPMRSLTCYSILSSGEKATYYYYGHRDALKTCRCRHKMKTVDNAVVGKLAEIALSPTSINNYIKSDKQDDLPSLERQLKSVQTERKRLLERKSKLLDLYIDGAWTKEELEEKKAEIDSAIVSLDRREDDINKKIKSHELPDINYESLSARLNIFMNFEKSLSPQEKIELIRECVQDVRVSKSGEVTMSIIEDNGNIICVKCT